MNDDGKINPVDALLTAQYYVHLNPDNFYPDRADVNRDGWIDTRDSLQMMKYYVDLIQHF